MSPVVVALLAGWVTLRVVGFRSEWPWRVVDLTLSRSSSGSRGRAMANRPSRSQGEGHQPNGNRRRSRRAQREVTAALPAAADLLRVAVSAGHSLHGAVAVVAEFGQGPVCEAMTVAHRRYERGSALVEELAALPKLLGPTSRSFASTLVMALSSGAPVSSALQRLADSERRRYRRQIEERVRRLPVLLLAPLIGLVLPAFMILTIVPVVLVTAQIDLAAPPPNPPSPFQVHFRQEIPHEFISDIGPSPSAQ
ncbi:MAG: type II secretion system F family protein [Microthrixaceae bacterium]